MRVVDSPPDPPLDQAQQTALDEALAKANAQQAHSVPPGDLGGVSIGPAAVFEPPHPPEANQ